MDYENRGPQTPVEWFDLLGAECFGPRTTREQLLRLEVAHVADVIAALISKKAAADAVAALFALLLAALLLTALRATPRALFAARPTHQAAHGAGKLVHVALTPRILAQRPVAARVCAG